MRERDLERATLIHAQIKKLEEDFGAHDKFGKTLRLFFELEGSSDFADKARGINPPTEWADVSVALDLHNDTLHARVNILIRTMLEEKREAFKTELRKLGIKLDDDEPKRKKEPLRISHLKEVKS